MKKRYSLIFCLLILLFSVGYIAHRFLALLPSKTELLSIELAQSARIWTQDGWLIGEVGEERRYPISISEIPERLQKAFLVVEDAGFYNHQGVEIKSLLRALWVDILAHQKLQGGSTISMQVARNFFLTRNKTFSRKLQEILLAWRIEQLLPKDKILELYLNKIFLGHRNFGVVAAAQFYFGKTLSELSIGEMAILAGLPKAPSLLNPLASVEECEARRNRVLLKMLDHGVISHSEYQHALDEPIYNYSRQKIDRLHDLALFEWIRKEINSKEPDSDDKTHIKTTIHAGLQQLASDCLSHGLLKILQQQRVEHRDESEQSYSAKMLPSFIEECVVIENYGGKIQIQLSSGGQRLLSPVTEKSSESDFEKRHSELRAGSYCYYDHVSNRLFQVSDLNGAVVILGPGSEILALVGGSPWQTDFFNRASQAKRPIASTIKSLIFSQALDQGFQAGSLIQDAPIFIKDQQGFDWRPQNHHHDYHGTLSLQQAFLSSSNLAILRLCQHLNLESLIESFQKNTLQKIPYLPESFCLGTFECSPLELARLYQSFTNTGLFPINNVILENETPCLHRLCSKQSAYVMKKLQEKFIAKYVGNLLPGCGGKTGTSDHSQDLWFAGHQQGLTCIVWIGCDEPKNLDMYAIRGAFPIWKNIALQSSKLYNAKNADGIPVGIKMEKNKYGELEAVITRVTD